MTDRERRMRDDRVFPATRVLGAVIVPFLLVAFALLYLLPGRHAALVRLGRAADDHAADHGRGLHRGRVLLRARGARDALASHPGRLPAGDGVHAVHGRSGRSTTSTDSPPQHVAFWIWVGLYVTTPVLVPLAWWRNRATDPRTPEPGEPPLPRFVRPALLTVGAFQSVVALVLLLSPSTMIEHWPWTADAADGADARRLVRAAGRDGADDGPRRALERDPDHAREPADRARADPARHGAGVGGRRHRRTRWPTCSWPGIAGLFVALLALECAMVARERGVLSASAV